MGTLADGTVVAPFANAAMRLLREDWKGKYGSKMLAEELFPILQTGIPNPDQNFQNFITINAGDTGSFAQLIDQFGNKLFEITAADGLKPIEPPGYPPPKLKPRIVWDEKSIAAGESIDSDELDAVAVDPETGAEVDGVYVYDPPDGTSFPDPGTASLYVNFTPTDGSKYRKAMGRTTLTIVGSPVEHFIFFEGTSAFIWLGSAWSAFGIVAKDLDTLVEVPGTYLYTPSDATVPAIGVHDATDLHLQFTPDDMATYDVTDGDVAGEVRGILRVQAAGSGVFGSNVTAGNVILAFATVTANAAGPTVAISDTQGNTYTQVGSYASADNGANYLRLSIWKTTAGSSGPNTVSVTPTGSSPTASVGANEYQGIDAVDQTTTVSSSAGGSGTINVSSDRELVVVYGVNANLGVDIAPPGFAAAGPTIDNVGTSTPNVGSAGLVDPKGGTSSSKTAFAGTGFTNPWAGIAASFTHRTS